MANVISMKGVPADLEQVTEDDLFLISERVFRGWLKLNPNIVTHKEKLILEGM